MKAASKPASQPNPEELRARIEAFVRACREPAVHEPGDKIIPLEDGRWDLSVQGGFVVLHAWSAETSLVRRITGVRLEQRDRLDLHIRRLGQGEDWLSILDLARAGPHRERHAARLEFRERFRRMLSRRFGEWEVAEISAGADLEHSLSPAYGRALLVRGQAAFAAIGVTEDADSAAYDHILSFGLIWLDYLRNRERRRVVESLKLFVPLKRSAPTANRLAFLDSAQAHYEIYEFGRDLSTALVDEKDYGNLSTVLDPAVAPPEPSPTVAGWIDDLCGGCGVERVARPDGVISLRIRGLEFARASGSVMTWGLREDQLVTPADFDRVRELAAWLGRTRTADASDKQHWLYRMAPEKWLESLVRANLTTLDSTLRPASVYSQLPAVAGVERGIMDLLASDTSGRLVVLELKAGEDIHLPLQGLDYWMRVKWHLDRGEFRKKGYFPGVELSPQPPRLLLVSPAFDFHPTTETILRYFSSQIEVERVGLGAEWRKELKVVFRARGAERPGSAATT